MPSLESRKVGTRAIAGFDGLAAAKAGLSASVTPLPRTRTAEFQSSEPGRVMWPSVAPTASRIAWCVAAASISRSSAVLASGWRRAALETQRLQITSSKPAAGAPGLCVMLGKTVVSRMRPSLAFVLALQPAQ